MNVKVKYDLTFISEDGTEKKFAFETKPPPLEVIKFFRSVGMEVPPALGGDEAAKQVEAKAAAEAAAKRQSAPPKGPAPMYVVHGEGPRFNVSGGRGFSGNQNYVQARSWLVEHNMLFEDPEVCTLTFHTLVKDLYCNSLEKSYFQNDL